ncbi:UDP-perosamine 4-acetyltransferase [Rhodovulum imhoffii]|uniref:UDP-perosamine 4-acetyltransferase n=1 Tax=Rhodovulum imhoffii TaxID=365340 RepID=A0A2T5BTZ7_9RHOB|nr:NeuD/PglB/VioB family sugar acetyltransferase [Rhodovulum imhoffii]MBK5932729.1 hypothetical protein [Rhodovulum imhoffii]PTN02935.1 UDP-perosamine 4-acetyltransferase [Rhodovulum imhoffii]
MGDRVRPVAVLGAGGHARVVAEALVLSGRRLAGYVAPVAEGRTHPLLGSWLGTDDIISDLVGAGHDLALGLGFVDSAGAKLRSAILAALDPARLSVVCHPAASVSAFAHLAPGTVVCAGAVVSVGAALDEGVLINSGAVVDHDCQVGANTHVAIGAHLAGSVHVGRDVLVGAGAVVRQGIRIGDSAVIGAGSVVIRDVPAGVTVCGIPARVPKSGV